MTRIARDDGALDELRPLVVGLKAHHGRVAPELGPVRGDDDCWAMTRARYAERLTAGDGALFVARAGDGRLAGFAFAAPAPPSADWPVEAIELEDLVVDPASRGAGVGHALLAAVRAHAGDREVRLGVLDANVGARRFYAREGFVGRARELVLAPGGRTVPDDLVRRALAEDVGTGDVTTAATVPAGTRARARITQKAPGVVFGLDLAEQCFGALDPDVRARRETEEGAWRDGGPVLALEGAAAALLSAERTALNLLAHLSGIATLTARYVRAVEGTGARILDTRKTTPGLRALEKAAVVAGGGTNHRAGLDDAILIKENHAAMAGGVGAAVRAARAAAPDLPLEVECRDDAEVDEALAAGAPRLLLDNLDPPRMRAIVARVGGRAELEASGGVTLETVRSIAETGVHFVSVGALTHSAPALDLSLLLEPEP